MSLTKVTYSMIKGAQVNVLDFIPDGTVTDTADCSDWIQTALDTNRAVFFPQGTYRITKTIRIPVYTSLMGEVGTVINADYTDTGTWAGDYRALLFLGLAGVDVAPAKFNTLFENMVITSTGASAVVATAITIAVGATSSSVLESRAYCYWRNIMVDGFDTAYALNQMHSSDITGLAARNVRIGVSIVGKTVNVFVTQLHLFKGTPVTSSVETSYGVYVDSYFRPAEERPESINISASLVAAFDINVQLTRALLVNLSNNVFDLGTGAACISLILPRGTLISGNWIDCGTVGHGIRFEAVADPTADDLVSIRNNTFSRVVNGVYASGRSQIHVIDNEFTGSSDHDVYFTSVDYAEVTSNRSKSTLPVCYISSSDYIIIDKNVTLATHPVSFNPTVNGTNIDVGHNVGSVQQTYVKGTAIILSTATTVDITAPMGSTGYVYPILRILNLNKGTVNPVLTSEVITYGATSSTIRITSSIAAPVDTLVIKYEVVGWWYGQGVA